MVRIPRDGKRTKIKIVRWVDVWQVNSESVHAKAFGYWSSEPHSWWLKYSYHGLRSSASPVLTATGFVNGRWQFSTAQRIHTPGPITKKFVASDYVGDPYGCAKFGANPFTGGFWANGWNITNFFLFLPFFHELTYRSDPRTDFYAWWLKLRGLGKDVLFGGFVDIASHFRVEIPRKP